MEIFAFNLYNLYWPSIQPALIISSVDFVFFFFTTLTSVIQLMKEDDFGHMKLTVLKMTMLFIAEHFGGDEIIMGLG